MKNIEKIVFVELPKEKYCVLKFLEKNITVNTEINVKNITN